MYSKLGYGDKDLFRYSFYALGLPYQQAPRIFATTGGFQTQNGEDSDTFCGHSSELRCAPRLSRYIADLKALAFMI